MQSGNTKHSGKSSRRGRVGVFKENWGLNRWKLKPWREPENLRLLHARHNRKSYLPIPSALFLLPL